MNAIEPRLDALESRIGELASTPTAGLTEPDPGSDERWETTQVWAHMAEFVGYWREQAELIIKDFAGEPVPFGRIKSDEGRLEAIETGRRQGVADLAEEVRGGLVDLRLFIDGLSTQDRQAVGVHVTRGEMGIDRLVEVFLLDHLEEHFDQLEGLGQRVSSG
ncbi:MAG TPA: hypothetical protein VMP67_05800 [Candidatus Limnocylindria bacterium]|nr:hypothetical protein [Candidatus Limnocylindria bacterium]